MSDIMWLLSCKRKDAFDPFIALAADRSEPYVFDAVASPASPVSSGLAVAPASAAH